MELLIYLLIGVIIIFIVWIYYLSYKHGIERKKTDQWIRMYLNEKKTK